MAAQNDHTPVTTCEGVDGIRSLFQRQQEYINTFFDKLDLEACNAVTEHITSCKGWVLVSGVGKSGSIASLYSDFLVSMGIKSRFLSPVNALHGDIGIVSADDVFIFISKSGETEELKQLVPFLKNRKAFLISLVSVKGSYLAKIADVSIELPLERELCPFGMAPVTSSILQLIFCATISIASMTRTQLSLENYAKNHPGGSIGRRLCLLAQDIMLTDFPRCSKETTLKEALHSMSVCGAVVALDENKRLVGIFTDGDLRRGFENAESGGADAYQSLMNSRLSELVKTSSYTAQPNELAHDIRRRMQANKIHQMLVIDSEGVVRGLILERDLIKLGL